MKNLGKIAVLAMTLAMALVLTACGGSSSSSAAASSSAASSSSAAASDSSASASSASASASSASASASSASSSASTATIEGDTYGNEYFGIEFSLPDGWAFIDTAAIENANAAIAKTSENAILDAIATSADQEKTVIIALEEASSSSPKTAEDYLAAQEEQLEASLEGNYAYVTKSATITFEGMSRELPASITTLTVNGVDVTIGQAVAEKDGVFLDIIITGSSEEDMTNLFSYFKATAE